MTTPKEWILNQLKETDFNTQLVNNKFIEFERAYPFYYANQQSFERAVRKIKTKYLETKEQDVEVIKENVKLAKQNQRLMDRNRIERKSFREEARFDNTLEDLNTNLIKILKDGFDLSINNKDIKTIKNDKDEAIGIFQLTDLHFNEIVESVYNNTYNFEVASKRLKKFVDEAKIYFKAKNIKKIVIAMTGDLTNNQKIEDKKLNQVYNRAYSLILGAYLLENVILDLSLDFNITVASVVGNEARIDDNYGFTNKIITDNFDFCIHNILKLMFRDSKNVNFIDGRFDEKILKIFNSNVLMLHGNTISKGTGAIQSLIGKYAVNNIIIDFVIFGHIHECSISDTFARSGSLVGNNNYSFNALQLYGRASQNIHIFYENGNRDSIKIDLQNIENYNGYKLDKKLLKEMSSTFVKETDIIFEI